MGVSIPRSEFWSFGPALWLLGSDSVSRFQFLGRNSGRSDRVPAEALILPSAVFQFLGRNSGRSDMNMLFMCKAQLRSFNSSVGILVVRTRMMYPAFHWGCRFQFLGRNSGRSDLIPLGAPSTNVRFQFLGRNSGRSDKVRFWVDSRWLKMFQFLGRNSGRSDLSAKSLKRITTLVSIPRWEFWSFGLY